MMLYLVVHTHGGELIQGDHHAFTQVATTCIAIQHVETVNVLEALQQCLLNVVFRNKTSHWPADSMDRVGARFPPVS
jgi:hypothetical protein